MAEELLKLQNIYKNFGNVKVLKDVNIKINKGEVVALIILNILIERLFINT